jgi:hypothetical protein
MFKHEDLKNAVKTSISYSEVQRKLGYSAKGGNTQKEIKKKIEEYEIDTKHFKGRSHGTSSNIKYELEEILIKNSTYSNIRSLKGRIISAGLLDYSCKECGINEWRGKKLSLHLDHINGINNDNTIENLRFLCPNCHSQTPTYGGSNIKNARSSRESRNRNQYYEELKRKIEDKNLIIKEKIISSNINFTKSGWISEISKITGISRNRVKNWMKLNLPEIYKNCYIMKK